MDKKLEDKDKELIQESRNKLLFANYQSELIHVIGNAVGRASMCWSNVPTSVFDSNAAVVVTDETVRKIQIVADKYFRQVT